MSRPRNDRPTDLQYAHIVYKCWFCGRENVVTWPKEFRYVGAKKSHECPNCDYMVHCEVIEPYPHNDIPRVKVSFDTLMWLPPDERTTT